MVPHEITGLLRAWSDGDRTALERLVPLVEGEMRRLARGYMRRERKGHTLQATALVNEVFVRLADAPPLGWQDRAHFLGIAARLMRRVLVDHARSRGYAQRGGGAQKVSLFVEAALLSITRARVATRSAAGAHKRSASTKRLSWPPNA